MEQSDEERGDDGNGSDLYEGAEDYRRLQAMNELDRETILADRSVGRSDKRMRMERLEQAGRIAGQVCVDFNFNMTRTTRNIS